MGLILQVSEGKGEGGEEIKEHNRGGSTGDLGIWRWFMEYIHVYTHMCLGRLIRQHCIHMHICFTRVIHVLWSLLVWSQHSGSWH